MANHASAKKRIRRNLHRNEIMGSRRNSIRSFVKKAEVAIAEGDKKAADAAYKVAESQLMRGARRGALRLKTASRKVSRLCAKVKALS